MEKQVAVGRRKASVARVYINKGDGSIKINNKALEDYFPIVYLQNKVMEPFMATNNTGKFDIMVNVYGGGVKGQAEAIRLGIARALVMVDAEFKPLLKAKRLMTRDARVVERKKPGLRKARKKEQYSKR